MAKHNRVMSDKFANTASKCPFCWVLQCSPPPALCRFDCTMELKRPAKSQAFFYLERLHNLNAWCIAVD